MFKFFVYLLSFECSCLLQNRTIGQQRGRYPHHSYELIYLGNSKQSAKTDAAKEGLNTLIQDNRYQDEKMAIISTVLKSKLIRE